MRHAGGCGTSDASTGSLVTFLLLASCLSWPVAAADWPQYRGPNRDDMSAETGLLNSWPAGGPPLAWTFAEAGVGYSGVAVAGDRVYTIGGRGKQEFLIALSASDGKQAWATPVVSNGRLYVRDQELLFCFDVKAAKQ